MGKRGGFEPPDLAHATQAISQASQEVHRARSPGTWLVGSCSSLNSEHNNRLPRYKRISQERADYLPRYDFHNSVNARNLPLPPNSKSFKYRAWSSETSIALVYTPTSPLRPLTSLCNSCTLPFRSSTNFACLWRKLC